MLVNLKNFRAITPQNFTIELKERLPSYLGPCVVNGCFSVENYANYYLMPLNVNANLTISCQRCLAEFGYHYSNETTIAICNSDEIAENLMNQYECVVSSDSHINLEDLLVDELYLYTSQFHPKAEDCDNEVGQYIGLENSSES